MSEKKLEQVTIQETAFLEVAEMMVANMTHSRQPMRVFQVFFFALLSLVESEHSKLSMTLGLLCKPPGHI